MKSLKGKFLQTAGLLSVLLIYSCGSQKDTVASRGMQNLTAHYNILFNANQLLDQSITDFNASYPENYDRLIQVYPEPTEALAAGQLSKLDEVIKKSNVIVGEKAQSAYVDDAYFLIGKANHYKANFFNATEFFDYISKTYPKNYEVRQPALAWQARSLMELERFDEARIVLDTALRYLERDKHSAGAVLAVRAQLDLYGRKDDEAIAHLQQAIKAADKKSDRLRWTYLLAQLQELKKNPAAALALYADVIKSNASFEMAFNANLSRIRIEDEQTGTQRSREDRLKALLKDEKNKDFADQIYYEIAQDYATKGNTDKALAHYQLSVSTSTKNARQKGLSYLAMAELFMKQAEYGRAKNYFDSTLSVLPKEYPDYELIRKKAGSLDYVSERLNTISKQDTLIMLAQLPETERQVRIGTLVREQVRKALTQSSQATGSNSNTAGNGTNTKFYFNNTTALTQGIVDFQKRWGTRKLEDNWRRSQRSSSDIVTSATENPNAPSPIAGNIGFTFPDSAGFRHEWVNSLPLNASQRTQADRNIANAIFELGNYYREVLQDGNEAITSFESLLTRYPDNEHKLASYYNLYRLYQGIDDTKSDFYKNLLLSKFPESVFAKVILDPNYNQKVDAQQQSLTKAYNEIFDLYTKKQYPAVIANIESLNSLSPGNAYAAQLAYLHALATGRLQKLGPFEAELQKIVTTFPSDQLILPLVKQHLQFIDSNREQMAARPFAIVDNDPKETFYVEEPKAEPVQTPVLAAQPVPPPTQSTPVQTPPAKQEPDPAKSEPVPVKSEEPVKPEIKTAETEKPKVAPKPASRFDLPETAEYYYVVNVLNPGSNLSSSRFGIGQFNRINFPSGNIKHQLKSVNNENQLIFVGAFSSKSTAAEYQRNIDPLLKEIMKLPADQYNTFIITKANLDKLNNRTSVQEYLDFFRSSY